MAISRFERAIDEHLHYVQVESGVKPTVDLNQKVKTSAEELEERKQNIARQLSRNIQTRDGLKSIAETLD